MNDDGRPRPRKFAVLAQVTVGRELVTTKGMGWIEGQYLHTGCWVGEEYIHPGYYVEGYRLEWFRGEPDDDDPSCDFFRWLEPPA